MREFTGKMPQTKAATTVLCEPVQSKRTWTCHNSHVMREFTGKNAADQSRAADLCEPAQSKCTHAEMYAGEQIEHSDQAPALTATVRTLQCGHTVWGKKRLQETSHNWKNCWMVET